MYDVSYDSEVQSGFHGNENATMSEYELGPEIQSLINKIGAAQTSGQSQLAAELTKTLIDQHLTAEVVQKLLPVIW